MELKMIKLNEILTNPLQPRQEFDRAKLQELANSIKEGELLQPIVVRGYNGKYEIVAGERRYKAFQILKEPKIPCIVRDIKDDTDALEKSLIENLQRDDLTSVERENAVYELWKSGRYKTYIELARKLGYSKERGPSFISEIVKVKEDRERLTVTVGVSTEVMRDTARLNDEPRKKILKAVEEKKIEPSKVRDVVRKVKEFPEPEQQIEILEEFEKQEEYTRESFDNIIEEKKRISKGERQPEWKPPQEDNRWFLDDMKTNFDKVFTYGVSNIELLPKIQKDEAVDIMAEALVYLMGQLMKLGQINRVRDIYESKINA